jgi:G:T/U-mismatch repair DNA glycosylase
MARSAPRRAAKRTGCAAPHVELVCFNGQTAARAAPAWRAAGYPTLALPSTSPAYTRPFAEKLAAWCVIADHLK